MTSLGPSFFLCCMKRSHFLGHTMRSIVALDNPLDCPSAADLTLRPATRAGANNHRPSVVIEVGSWCSVVAYQFSQPITLCDCDSRSTKPKQGTRLLEHQRITRHTPPLVPRCEQEFGIDSAGAITTTHALLTIPYTSIFVLPHPTSADIILHLQNFLDLQLGFFPMATFIRITLFQKTH